jgi:hypothetical protein
MGITIPFLFFSAARISISSLTKNITESKSLACYGKTSGALVVNISAYFPFLLNKSPNITNLLICLFIKALEVDSLKD